MKYLSLPSCVLLLAACSTQDEPRLEEPVAAEFSAVIDEPISRAHDALWESGDAIGISSSSYSNVKYLVSNTSTGKFSPASGNGIFFQNTSNVTFSAYYPFGGTSGTARGTISASTSDQSSSKTFDFLWAQTTANYQSPTVKFNFTHKMTRLILQLKTDANAGFSASDVSSGTYKLSGIKHSGTFNTSNGTAAATGTVTNDWTINATASTSSNVRTYNLIFFPQSGAKLTLTATIGGQDYACDFTPGLAAGTSYTYTITIKKTGLEVSGASITNWTTGASGTGTATPTAPASEYNAVLMRAASADLPALYIADRNVGAESPEDIGMFFWWGDTQGVFYDSADKTLLDKDGNIVAQNTNVRSYFNSSNASLIMTYYKTLSDLYSNGILTSATAWDDTSNYLDNVNAGRLTSEYDAATVIMGEGWRMMTGDDIEWLTEEDEDGNFKNCEITFIKEDSTLIGFTIKSKSTNNEVFFPQSGYFDSSYYSNNRSCYWSSTPCNDNYHSYSLYFGQSGNNVSCYSSSRGRYYGMPIRAVLSK